MKTPSTKTLLRVACVLSLAILFGLLACFSSPRESLRMLAFCGVGMTLTLSSFTMNATMKATLANSIDGGAQSASCAQGFTSKPTTTFTSGTTDSKANRIWSDTERTLTSGNSEDIDLYDFGALDIGGGAGKDALGQTLTLAEVTGLHVYVHSTSTGSLLVGGKAAATAWNSLFGGSDDDAFLLLKPGSTFYIDCPPDPAYAVTDTSNHLLKMAASGGDVTYDITVMGRNA